MRTGIKRGLLASILIWMAVSNAHAQSDWPTRSIKLVVPFSAGGGTDAVARAFAKNLGTSLKQPVVVDNRDGAGSTIGTQLVANAPADGYTALFASAAYSVSPAIYPKLAYSQNDFTAVGILNSTPLMLVINPNLIPARTLGEFIALLKENPGKYNYASSGVGSTLHISAEYFVRTAGLSAMHVPYKGEAPAITGLLGGQVAFMIVQASTGVPYVKSGKLIGLGVTTPKRLESMPDMPTIAEGGLNGFSAYGWNAVLVPHGTNPAIVKHLNQEMTSTIQSPELKQVFRNLELQQLDAMSPEEATTFIKRETEKWGSVIKAAGIKAQ